MRGPVSEKDTHDGDGNLDSQAASLMSTIQKTAPALLQRLQQGLSNPPVELVYAPYPRWPLPHPKIMQQRANRPLSISILDSSFNPPTLAHLALENAHRPEPHNASQSDSRNDVQHGYDAKLLLLSVKNADKTLKAGDATYLQRLEMMFLLAQRIQTDYMGSDDPSSESAAAANSLSPQDLSNVAIAIIDEPTFVGKSEALLAFLQHRFTALSHSTSVNDIELTFLVGLDTLERLFSPRYYASPTIMMASLRKFLSPGPGGDNSRIVCARRTFTPSTVLQPSGDAEEAESQHLAKEFIESGRIVNIDIGEDLSTYSSSGVRAAIGRFGLGRKCDADAAWRNFVTKEVAEYIVEERLYESNS